MYCCTKIYLKKKKILKYKEYFNLPSRLPVTISGAPSPIPSPPTPSMVFIISLWPFTEYTGISGASKFLDNTTQLLTYSMCPKHLVHYSNLRMHTVLRFLFKNKGFAVKLIYTFTSNILSLFEFLSSPQRELS